MKEKFYQYHLSWYTKDLKKMPLQAFRIPIEQSFQEVCEKEKGRLVDLTLKEDTISLKVEMLKAIYPLKFIKQLQREASKTLKSNSSAFKEWGPDSWEKEALVAMKPPKIAKEEERLEKMIGSIVEVGYYDLKEYFTQDMDYFKAYLLERRLGVIDEGERTYLLDEEALTHFINLNCFACTKIHPYGCCCGSPCDFGSRNLKCFQEQLPFIGERMRALDEENYKKVMENGGFIKSDGRIRAYDGHCSLLVKEGEVYKCLAHKYALEQEIPVYALAPLSCLMYPLEVMVLYTQKKKKILLFTSVVNSYFADRFGRWGSYDSLGIGMRCLKKESHNALFIEKDYRPVYEVNKGLIAHEWGDSFYEMLQKLVE